MKGLLLAGGRGTRLRPLTFTGNKHLLPIANKPMILYGLEHLINTGVKEIGVILGPIKEGVVELLGDGSKFGADITYIEQTEPKGLAHTVIVAQDFLQGGAFVMYLGDNMLKLGAEPFVRLFNENEPDCVIGVARVREPSRYGVVQLNGHGRIIRLVEKPKEYVSDWALVGVYVFNERVFDVVKKLKPSWRGELEITDAIQLLVNEGARIDVQFVEGWWKDTGRPEDLLEANRLVLHDLEPYNMGEVEAGATVVGNVCLGRNSKVRSDTAIRGPAIIGEDCEVGPAAYIGPYTSIGNGVTIGNSEVENSIIMDDATIDCGKRIIDSIIGRGAKVLNSDRTVPKGRRLILGDTAYVSI